MASVFFETSGRVGVLHVMDATPGLLCQVTIRKVHGKTRIASLMYCFGGTHTICCLVPLVSLWQNVNSQRDVNEYVGCIFNFKFYKYSLINAVEIVTRFCCSI